MSSDSYSSYTAYSWNLDKRITVQEALYLRDRGGRGSRAGDCACHKKCYQNKTHQVVFPRRCTDRRSHFVRNKRYTSRGCGIRRQVNRVNEDTGRNNYFEQFLSDLYYHLAGSGGMSVPGQNLSGPKHLHDIQSVAIATSRSADSPDITITHGFRTDREKTHIFIVNTSRYRSYYSEAECTEYNTIVIDIFRWPEQHIAEFENWGVRKFDEEMELLEKRIDRKRKAEIEEEKKRQERERILISGYRQRIGYLVAEGKVGNEWKSWFEGNPSDQSVKDTFEKFQASIEELERQLASEKKAAAEAEAAEARAKAEAEAAEARAKAEAQRIAREEFERERRRRIRWLTSNSDLADSLQRLIPDIDGYEFSRLLRFCLFFSGQRKSSTESQLGRYISQYLRVEDQETTQEEFLAGVLDNYPVIASLLRNFDPADLIRTELRRTDPELTTFELINEHLEKEIVRIKAKIHEEKLGRLRSSFEEIFETPPPDDWKDDSKILQTHIRQKGAFRKLWSEYEHELKAPPPRDIKLHLSRLEKAITTSKRTKEAEAKMQSMPSMLEELSDLLETLRKKIVPTPQSLETVFDEWSQIIEICNILLDPMSNSIESDSDKGKITHFITSNGFDGPIYTLRDLVRDVEDFPAVPIISVAGYPRPTRALPWRKISTHREGKLRTKAKPNAIRYFKELYSAIEEGIDNLSHVSDWKDEEPEREKERAAKDKAAEEMDRQKKMGSRPLVTAARNQNDIPHWGSKNPRRAPKKRRRIGSSRRKTQKEIKDEAKKKASEIVDRITNPDTRDK